MQRLTLLAIILLLSGCFQREPFPYPPTATPYMTPTPSIGVLKAADGTILAKTYCETSGGGMYTFCATHFPNGETIRDIPYDWSADGRYAAACIGATHDTSCGYGEVWDMIHGKKLLTFSSPYCFAWSPTAPSRFAYLDEQGWSLVLDVETGEISQPSDYPDWYRAKYAQSENPATCLKH